MPLCAWLWRRWWALLHCWIFNPHGLLGRSVHLLDSVLVFLRGRMRRSVLQESFHFQCIVVSHFFDKQCNQGIGDMLPLFLMFHMPVMMQLWWARRLTLSQHNVNNKVICRQCFELVWFCLIINFLLCWFVWVVVFSRTQWVCVFGGNQLINVS